jgi:hypothetical protein
MSTLATCSALACRTLSSATHLRVPNAAGYTPTTNGHFGYDSTANRYLGYIGARVVTFGHTAGTRTSGKCLEFDSNGDIVVAVSNAACGSGGSGLSGMTTNVLQVATSSTTIGDSQVSQDGTTGQISTAKGFNAPATVVTFGATPAFDLALGNRFEITLTGNITSSTFTHLKAGARGSIVYTQDATGSRTNVAPTGSANFCTISGTASVATTQLYEVAADGTTVNGVGCTSTDTPTLITGPTRSAPGTPAASTLACWFDSTDNVQKCKDPSGNVFVMTKAVSATSNQFVTNISTTGVQTTAQPAFSNLSGAATLAQGGTANTTAPDDNVLVGNGTTWISDGFDDVRWYGEGSHVRCEHQRIRLQHLHHSNGCVNDISGQGRWLRKCGSCDRNRLQLRSRRRHECGVLGE